MKIRKRIDQLKKFRSFLGKEVWSLFVVSVVAGVFMFLIESSFVLVLQGFLNGIGLVHETQLSLPEWYPTGLNMTVLILLVFGLCRGLIYMIKSYISNATGVAFARLQRTRTVEYALMNAEKVATHEVSSIVSERVGQAGSVLQNIAHIILVTTSSILFLLMGLKIAPKELMIAMVILALTMIPLRIFTRQIHEASEGVRIEWDNVNRLLLQGLRHHFLFKIYGLLEQEVSKAKVQLVTLEKHFRSYFYIFSIKSFYPNIAGIFVICMVTFISIKYLHTPGITLVAFFYLFIRIAQGAGDINSAFASFKLFLPSFKEVYHWHEKLKLQQEEAEKQVLLPTLSNVDYQNGVSIEVQNLSFGYGDGPTLFQSLNFSIKKGDVLLIKGESGVGKSTILNLAIGLLKPRNGKVLVNGHPVEQVQRSLFEKIAYVGPEPYLIAGTIRENLLFGHYDASKISDEQMREALAKAQLSGERYDLNYFVNEQTPMSTGQKQRLSIARGFLRQPSLLILDEATANLDGATESKFIESVEPMLKGITTMIVSHKPSFDKIATSVLEMKRPV